MKPVFDVPVEGARSIVGFGLASQTGFESVTGTITANSSGEHDISLTSPLGAVTRGRFWANAVVDQTANAKSATKARGNSFRNSIDRELPFPNFAIHFLVFLK
jgi:hypothetical protein